MVQFLLTDRSTTQSLLSLRIIMEHKKGHISHESELAADNRTQGHAFLGVSGHVCSWRTFQAFERTDKVAGTRG